jgi:ABC-2 type transport system permease protein
MHPDITWLDMANRRRSLIGYCLGMAVYALVVVAMYPAFKTSTSLDKLIASDSTAAALFGVTGPISTSGGWLNGNIYANFLPLIMLLLTIGYGAACLAGQDEDGTLGLLAVLPVRRTAIVMQKAAAMAAQAAALTVTVAVLVIIGRSFQLDITVANVASVSAVVFLMGMDFGLVTMAAGALAGRRGPRSARGRRWQPPPTWSARWRRWPRGSGRDGTRPCSTGRSGTARSAAASAPATTRC